jgi:hypothetical protein
MGLQKLAIVGGCLVLFAGAFAAAFLFIPSRSKSAPPNDGLAVVDADFKGVPPATQPDGPNLDANDTGRSSMNARTAKDGPKKPKDGPKKPYTCADATKSGNDCVSRRVTWVGEWTHSQSAMVNRKMGASHIFNTVGPAGAFSFDYPFIAEDPHPLPSVPRGMNMHDHFNAKWGPTRIVTVTGTIARVERLIMIGKGTRDDVPVLTDITITINP